VISRQVSISLGILLVCVVCASADSKGAYPLTLKVLTAKTESIPLSTGSNEVANDCGTGVDFSAYCHSTRKMILRNTMQVQDDKGKSFTIFCTVDSRWSNCTPLPVGEKFGAQKEKHGFAVWIENSKGKEVKQSYTLMPNDKAVVAEQPSSTAANPASSSVASSPAIPESNRETIKCNFSSTPSGAEITLDGRYVGNTPSVVGITTGNHVVVLFMPGFDQWKRELTVSPGSDLNVSANLQKTPQ
jgi:PEGA domain